MQTLHTVWFGCTAPMPFHTMVGGWSRSSGPRHNPCRSSLRDYQLLGRAPPEWTVYPKPWDDCLDQSSNIATPRHCTWKPSKIWGVSRYITTITACNAAVLFQMFYGLSTNKVQQAKFELILQRNPLYIGITGRAEIAIGVLKLRSLYLVGQSNYSIKKEPYNTLFS